LGVGCGVWPRMLILGLSFQYEICFVLLFGYVILTTLHQILVEW